MVSRGALTFLEETRPQQKHLRLDVSGNRFISISVLSVKFLIESIVDVFMGGAELGSVDV